MNIRLYVVVFVILTVFFSTINCLAGDSLEISVTDDCGRAIKEATLRGMIEFSDGETKLFEEYTDEDGIAFIKCPEGVKIYLWVEKRGWIACAYKDKPGLEIPDPIDPKAVERITMQLVKKNSAQLY